MKLFLISNMYPTPQNPGYGIFVKNVCDGLEGQGVYIAYSATIEGKGKNLYDKVWKYIKFYILIVINYFKDYDCIYVHFPNQASPILSILEKIRKRPVVFNFHGEDLLYNENLSYSRYLGRKTEELAKQCVFIIVPSSYFKDIVVDRGLVSPENVVVSPSGGINTDVFNYNESKQSKDYIHLGFVGRLEEDKGILEFVEACKILNRDYKLKATIIGYGPLASLINEKISDLSYFTIINGVKQDELPSYYRGFDLFCFPSMRKAESLGLVGIEAMACGTPVLGSDIGGIKSYVKHGGNGYLLQLDHLVDDMVKYGSDYIKMDDKKKKQMELQAVETAKLYSRNTVCEQLAVEFKNRVNQKS